MKKNVLLIATFIIALLGLQSCSGDNDKVINNTARVQLKLVDSPGDYLEVNVEIVDVLYNNSENEEGWISITPEGFTPTIVDLTKLIAGNDFLLSDVIIPSGMLKQVRLVLGDKNTLVIEGEQEGEIVTTHLDTPSAQQSGLKLKLDTELEPGYSYTFILDWDVQKSIVKAGNSGKYILKPVIRVNTEVNSGSIKGKVVGGAMEGEGVDGTLPLKNAKVSVYTIDGTDITSTLTDENGNFIIRGLNQDDYKIKIEHIDYINYESGIISVVVGEVSDTGTIELIVPVS